MSPIVADLPAAILETILGRLALLFLTGLDGSIIDARNAARQMLEAYDPQSADELRLAAEIVSFGFHALDALGQSADPTLSLSQKLRLRGSAVSLSRESHKSWRKLDQLQKARRTREPAQPVETPVPPPVKEPLLPVGSAGNATAAEGRNGGQTWTQGYQQREAARRITENLKKNKTRQTNIDAARAGEHSGIPGLPTELLKGLMSADAIKLLPHS